MRSIAAFTRGHKRIKEYVEKLRALGYALLLQAELQREQVHRAAALCPNELAQYGTEGRMTLFKTGSQRED